MPERTVDGLIRIMGGSLFSWACWLRRLEGMDASPYLRLIGWRGVTPMSPASYERQILASGKIEVLLGGDSAVDGL